MTRTILVTGASKGIGRAIARRLAADGFSIAVHYGHDREGGEATLACIRSEGHEGHLVSFDIADLDSFISAHGPFYGAVLNAGIARDAAFPAMAGDEWDAVLTTNLDGFYNVLKPLVMPMVSARKGGRIVTLSSVSGLLGNRGQVNYSAAKAGIIGATKALAVELAKRNITVNCVAPGLINTQMVKDAPKDLILDAIPMRRIGRPEDVAAAVSFLCSDDAAYITRQVLSVNGGMA